VTLVGALGGRRRAAVGRHGTVAPSDAAWVLDWWIGADDRWRVPARETTVRQSLVNDAPVVRTAMRVPGGDAVQHVYGAAGIGEPIVIEIENESPAPFVVAFVVRGARTMASAGTIVAVDQHPALLAPRAPSRWAVGNGTSAEVQVCSGAAVQGVFPPRRDRAGRLEAAFLHPVAHRTTLRIALVAPHATEGVDLASLPSPADAARGWLAQLDRGMRVELPDERLLGAVRAARAEVLLAGTGPSPNGAVVAALEDWGFDVEAGEAWRRLGGRERRRAGRREPSAASWETVARARLAGHDAEMLLGLRALLVVDDIDAISVLNDLPAAWRGAAIDVHDAPTRAGLVSYSLRWHGERPAFLWEVPSGVVVRAPGLDADWSTTEPSGEALLSGQGRAA
jgi:hypothetical protein